ncbi:MAG: PilZ domain-containing protein [Burkholderiales bacterium]|nr:PilZ domain-containing protein [Burkholderiales bacterium]
MIEQRQHPRKFLEVDAVMADEFGNFMRPVKLLNISRMGLAFATNEMLAPGTLYMFRFNLPEQERKVRFTASVVHSSTNTELANFRVGARFAKIDEEDLALIEQYINE